MRADCTSAKSKSIISLDIRNFYFQLTMSLLKLFPSESVLNTLTEYDVLFPVPLHPYKLPNKRLKRQIERDIIHQKLKSIASM